LPLCIPNLRNMCKRVEWRVIQCPFGHYLTAVRATAVSFVEREGFKVRAAGVIAAEPG
jgi:hypothetical protein